MAGQTNDPSKRRRDYTGVMVGAALRQVRRAHAGKPASPPTRSGSLLLTVLIVVVVLVGMLYVMTHSGS
ncbi:MAG: hypothetical protein AB7O43_03085 [Hyphomicrobiaceae bacterium]